jgi:hypothetical protein
LINVLYPDAGILYSTKKELSYEKTGEDDLKCV